MNDFSDFQKPRPPLEKIDLADLDLRRIGRFARLGVVVLAVILGLSALGWAQNFYTDLLWFRGVGHEAVLVKIVTTRVVLFLLALAAFLALALPNLYPAARSADRRKSDVTADKYATLTFGLHVDYRLLCGSDEIGVQLTLPSISALKTTFSASVPSALITQISSSRMKAMWLPSGDQRGC